MPQYAVFLYAPADDDTEPEPAARDEHHRHAAELRDSGKMVAAFALEDPATATSIRSDGSITDGPFIEAKEVILGFYVLEAHDLDGALAVAGRNPIIRQGGGVEVRPVEGGEVRPSV